MTHTRMEKTNLAKSHGNIDNHTRIKVIPYSHESESSYSHGTKITYSHITFHTRINTAKTYSHATWNTYSHKHNQIILAWTRIIVIVAWIIDYAYSHRSKIVTKSHV